MIITILTGEVSADKVRELQKKYEQILSNKPSSISQTYLIRDTKNRTVCRIITVWKSREVLEEMRTQGTPAGVLLFRNVGVEPSLSVHEVIGFS
jgi:hypothetical protein